MVPIQEQVPGSQTQGYDVRAVPGLAKGSFLSSFSLAQLCPIHFSFRPYPRRLVCHRGDNRRQETDRLRLLLPPASTYNLCPTFAPI